MEEHIKKFRIQTYLKEHRFHDLHTNDLDHASHSLRGCAFNEVEITATLNSASDVNALIKLLQLIAPNITGAKHWGPGPLADVTDIFTKMQQAAKAEEDLRKVWDCARPTLQGLEGKIGKVIVDSNPLKVGMDWAKKWEELSKEYPRLCLSCHTPIEPPGLYCPDCHTKLLKESPFRMPTFDPTWVKADPNTEPIAGDGNDTPCQTCQHWESATCANCFNYDKYTKHSPKTK